MFGVLGPNGAGKTTTIEIMEGYKVADGGRATVLGLDPRQDQYALRERIGIMLQETALYPDLNVGELLRLFASYYHNPVDTDALLEMIGLEEKGAFIRDLSGGQAQRVVFVLALINDPELLFLDEPTAGLDPQSRRAIWEWIGLARRCVGRRCQDIPLAIARLGLLRACVCDDCRLQWQVDIMHASAYDESDRCKRS